MAGGRDKRSQKRRRSVENVVAAEDVSGTEPAHVVVRSESFCVFCFPPPCLPRSLLAASPHLAASHELPPGSKLPPSHTRSLTRSSFPCSLFLFLPLMAGEHDTKECGGSSFCEHGSRKQQCKECGGSSICEHGRRNKSAARQRNVVAPEAVSGQERAHVILRSDSCCMFDCTSAYFSSHLSQAMDCRQPP